jgi:hypothetical protein
VELTDEMVAAKWAEIAPLIDIMISRIQDPNDFALQPNSELAADDAASKPYHVSHAARWCLNSGVEHLHALKSLVIDAGLIHSAASYTLARGALENFAAGHWILHPPERSVRIEHGLRWWTKNFRDQDKATKTAGLPDTKPVKPKLEAIVEIGKAAGCDLKELKSPYFSTPVLEYADEYSTAIHPHLIWQICSGFAHGRPWASIGINEMETQSTPEEGVLQAKFTSDHKRLLAVTLPAFHLMTDVVRLFQDRTVTLSSGSTS